MWQDNRGIESVRALFEIRSNQYTRAILSTAFVNGPVGDSILRAVLRFGREDDGYRDDAGPREYGGLSLERTAMAPDLALTVLEGLVAEAPPIQSWEWGSLQFPNPIGIRTPGDQRPQPFPSRARYRWPNFNFIFQPRPNPAVNDPRGPLVAPNLPPLLNPNSMVNEWLDTDWNQYGGANYVEVVLPDFRARVDHVELLDGTIKVSVEHSDGIDYPVRVQASATTGAIDKVLDVGALEGGSYPVRIREPWSQFAFFILDEAQREIVDWVQIHSTIAYPANQVVWRFPERQLDQVVEEWENQFVEFKTSTHPPEDIVQSIVAFSNSNDGTILVGVNEAREVVGVTRPEREEERIRSFISELCDPPVNPTFDILPYRDKSILVIRVARGSDGPYVSRFNGVIYVRRGAYDFPAKTRNQIDNLYPR